MSYIEKTLMPNEEILYQGKLSLWSFAKSTLLGLLFLFLGLIVSNYSKYGFFGFIIAAFIALNIYARYSAIELGVTNKRIVIKQGLISRKTIELLLQKVESVQVEQSILGRIFSFGDIVVLGVGTTYEPFRCITNPMGFRQAVNEAIGNSGSK